MLKELEIAPKAVLVKAGWFMTFWMLGIFIKIPIIGGIRINAKKIMIAER